MLMDPAFPDLVGEWAATESDPLGSLADGDFFESLDDAETADEIADAIIVAAALRHVEDTRDW